MEKYLTVDIGGTFIKYSMMDSAYHVYEEGSLATAKASWEFLEQLKSVVLKYKGRKIPTSAWAAILGNII